MSDLLYFGKTTGIDTVNVKNFTLVQAINAALNFIEYESCSRFYSENIAKEVLEVISLLSFKEKWKSQILTSESEIAQYFERINIPQLPVK